MPSFFPLSDTGTLADSVLLNRAVYGGNLELPDTFLNDYDPARDPSNAGIRPDLNVYDRYDDYLAQFGFQTLGASELGFDPADVTFADDNQPGDGTGVEKNWFYDGDLYRNHHVQEDDGSTTVFDNAAAIAIAAVKEENGAKTLHLVFRGTDADLGSDGEAGTGPGQVRYYGQLKPLIDQARAYAEDAGNGITDVVISGHSLGGSMVDMFALYDGAAFDAIANVDLKVVALASAGIDPVTLQTKTNYDQSLVTPGGANGFTFTTPDWYTQYDNFDDIVRNPERYDFAAHSMTDPQQAPVTRAAVSTLEEHIEFTENRLRIEAPLLDQYLAAATLETLFLPQHYSSLYELHGLGIEAASAYTSDLDYDRIIALGGVNPNITGTSGTNNANGFGVPEDNTIDFSAETGTLLVMGLSGDDVITGGTADDLLDGGTGDDVLAGGAGADILAGSDGIDRVDYSASTVALKADLQIAAVNTGDAAGDVYFGIENLSGGDGNDDLRGNNSDNRIDGRAGNDVLNGRAGDDDLRGNSGDDVLFGGAGGDRLNGGGGTDRAAYNDASAGVKADLQFASLNEGFAAGDTYVSVENLSGSAFDDNLRGDAAANRLEGLAGNDLIFGRDGDDILIGGDGDDVLYGGLGADRLAGGAGIDRAQYSSAVEGITADLQRATLNKGTFAVGDSYSLIEGLQGSSHNDDLRGNGLDNTLIGGNGEDILTGRNGDDALLGGAGNDSLTGGNGADALDGGAGIDRANYIDGISGVTADLQAAQFNKGIAAGDTYINIENLRGSRSGDDLRGDSADNFIAGFEGNDFLTGRNGDDELRGGDGDDVLKGGNGADFLAGSTGNDAFLFNTPEEGGDTILDFQINRDTIRLNASNFTSLTVGTLSADNFVSGPAALDADDFILYDGTTLSYDADGSGAGAATVIATLSNNANIDAEDFFIV